MTFVNDFFRNQSIKRISVLLAVGLFLYISRSLFDLILFTFIFTFLMYNAEMFLNKYIRPGSRIKSKYIVIIFVLALAVGFGFGFTNQIAEAVKQLNEVVQQVKDFYNQPAHNSIEDFIKTELQKLGNALESEESTGYIMTALSGIGRIGFNVFISLILSIFFLLERERVIQFTLRFKSSKIAFFYNEIQYFGKIFTRSFGKVIETQILIACINGILSAVTLWIMGFPHVLGLGIMILILGFIPVLGVIISLIPLCIIAFTSGGIMKVISVLIMIAVLHALESYVLNPKLMSSKVKLPVFYTFIVLLISEHFFGTWGLIIGIPAFIFMLEMLGVMDEKELSEKKHRIVKKKLNS